MNKTQTLFDFREFANCKYLPDLDPAVLESAQMHARYLIESDAQAAAKRAKGRTLSTDPAAVKAREKMRALRAKPPAERRTYKRKAK